MEGLASGSYLVLSAGTGDFAPEEMANVPRVYNAGGLAARVRTKTQIEMFFNGLDLLSPGVVQVHKWRPDPIDVGAIEDGNISAYGGLACKK
jgi:S-adenosyl methyltransferase